MKWSSPLSALLASTASFVSANPVASRELKLFNLKILSPINANLNGRYLTINPDGSVGIFSDHPVVTGSIPPKVPVPPSVPSADTAAAKPPPGAKFYVTQAGPTGSPDASHYELHSYPIGIVDHALGLNGTAKDGIRYLVDVTNPSYNASAGSDGGNSPDWKSFTLDNYGSNNVDANGDDGRAEIDIEINLAKRIPPPMPLNGFYYGSNGHGKWVLIQRGSNTFVAAWYDGTSYVTQNYRLVDITYEPADA
ncbi:hypothetical protein Sste5346_000762 [Sporothrix stenoceras]|uniref:Uncharacterized protein n=1 Tax=Sporothrix stenoceras TaxID=5173 RepID=A0ABR3ZQB7_9PEZI